MLMKFKYEKEFRKAHPETIGEKESIFDLVNYTEWLETIVGQIEPLVMQKIAVVVEDLFKLYEQGDFSNGVECCGMDQGEIHARDYINNLRIDWNKIKAENNGRSRSIRT